MRRFLGYEVEIFERGNVAEQVAQWGTCVHVQPIPDELLDSRVASLRAQDPDFLVPDEDEILTGREWRERYLRPLSQTDLLVDHVAH